MNIFQKLGNWLVTNWKYLQTANKLDQEDIEMSKKTGIPLPVKNGNLKNWFKMFGVGTIILFASVFIIWDLIKPRPSYQKSHHGVNKYGERY